MEALRTNPSYPLVITVVASRRDPQGDFDQDVIIVPEEQCIPHEWMDVHGVEKGGLAAIDWHVPIVWIRFPAQDGESYRREHNLERPRSEPSLVSNTETASFSTHLWCPEEAIAMAEDDTL